MVIGSLFSPSSPSTPPSYAWADCYVDPNQNNNCTSCFKGASNINGNCLPLNCAKSIHTASPNTECCKDGWFWFPEYEWPTPDYMSSTSHKGICLPCPKECLTCKYNPTPFGTKTSPATDRAGGIPLGKL